MKIDKKIEYCHKCGMKIVSDSKFCSHCGEPIAINESQNIETKKPVLNENSLSYEYFYISPLRLSLLSILTLGFYEIYWFYRNWEIVKTNEKSKILPLARAIFSIFYCGDLFRKILGSAKKNGYKNRLSASSLSLVYIVMSISGTVLVQQLKNNPLAQDYQFLIYVTIFQYLIMAFSFIPILFVQKAANYNNKVINVVDKTDNKNKLGEIITIVIGLIILLFHIFANLSAINNIDSKLKTQSDINEMNTLVDNSSNLFKDTDNESKINEIVRQAKSEASFPQKVDENTTWVDVTPETNAVRFHYIISGADTSQLTSEDYKIYVTPLICANDYMRSIIDYGINVEASYFDETANKNFLISISRNDCK